MPDHRPSTAEEQGQKPRREYGGASDDAHGVRRALAGSERPLRHRRMRRIVATHSTSWCACDPQAAPRSLPWPSGPQREQSVTEQGTVQESSVS
ncbi:hypothetical protein GGP73_001593 [Salinibacter ruber]|nr:hypothetical protein [Salinibacter ruber]